MARRFLTRRSSTNGGAAGAEVLSGIEVAAYLLEQCSRLAVESAQREAADLRALLRFLYLHGLIGTDLGVAVPPGAGWRDTRRPPPLTTPERAPPLESRHRARPAGLRDLA